MKSLRIQFPGRPRRTDLSVKQNADAVLARDSILWNINDYVSGTRVIVLLASNALDLVRIRLQAVDALEKVLLSNTQFHVVHMELVNVGPVVSELKIAALTENQEITERECKTKDKDPE